MTNIALIACAILVPIVGWLFNQVIKIRGDSQAMETKIQAVKDSCVSNCAACQRDMDRRITDNKGESDRRFNEIRQILADMSAKLDKLMLRD
ncbi:MAG TPA: hypothetical protein VGP72_10455 [Planctomycetota bacterium]